MTLTLRQRKLTRVLGEDWFLDYQRRRAGGWSNREIAGFYSIQIGRLSESAIVKWAAARGLQSKERAA